MTKKLRFEVFKRDSFTCQYCGRKVPDVILEVDHIFPKSKGGLDEIVNLITSCFDCNRGKGKRELSQITRPDIESINKEMLEKKEQLKEYHKYLRNESNRIIDDLDYICTQFTSITGMTLLLKEKLTYKQFLKHFDKYKICEAIEIAFIQSNYGIFKYSCGILWKWVKNNG